MGAITAKNIKEVSEREPTKVELPDFDTYILVKRLSIADREKIEQASKNDEISDNHTMALMLSLCLVDDDGSLAFTKSQINVLRETEAILVSQMFEGATRANTRPEGND